MGNSGDKYISVFHEKNKGAHFFLKVSEIYRQMGKNRQRQTPIHSCNGTTHSSFMNGLYVAEARSTSGLTKG
ncbi:MAG: hypothetical protein DYG98_26540 [Haliscomenobacteraceae bacterium CHB4]|nr:hypothetical protein [Haliscomenobacteraceae bacterium CHB4]